MSDPRESNGVYVAREPCGCVVGLCCDNPHTKRDTAKVVADWIRGGCTIALVSFEESKALARQFGHTCDKAKRTTTKLTPLFAEDA